MCVSAVKISSIVTVLGPVATTTTALADIHTIDALACQSAAKAIVRWRPTAQVLSGQLTQAAKSQDNPLDDYRISLDCIRTLARAKSSVMLKTPRSEICLH